MKRLITLLLTFVAVWSASANPIDKQQARQLAEKFLQGKGTVISNEAAARSIRRNLNTANQPFYVFNTTRNRGFVIVAGDDSMEPIIGYTTQGSFDEDDLPENFKAWLEQTAAEIEAAGKQPAQTRGTSGPKPVARTVAIHQEVKPLIITTWDQGNSDNVYNSHLPLVEGQLPCTGCVATAGAQVMYYYHKDLPSITLPVPGYSLTDSDGEDYSHGADTSADLPAIQFQWDKMKTSYGYKDPEAPNSEEEDAIADLMLYCGYAAHMNYGLADKHGGSGASTSTLAEGMSKYFGFNPNTWKEVYRYDYSVSEWDEIVYNELANGRPIIYSGGPISGGHAFICDGYDGEGMYHFNWGWGGSYNGYFKLQATNPYGESNISKMGYIVNNDCIIGLQPNSWPDIIDPNSDDTWEIIEVKGSVTDFYNLKIEGTTITAFFVNKNDEDLAFGFAMGELLDDGSMNIVENYESEEDKILKSWYSRTLSFDVSGYGLSEGSHKLVPLNKLKGETEWKRCRPTDIYYEVVVSGGTYTIILHPVEDFKINEFDLATGGTPDYSQAVNVNITNNGDNLDKLLNLYVGTADDIGKYAGGTVIRIAAGNTKDFRIRIRQLLEAGNYTLRLSDGSASDVVLAQKDITITQDLQATNFEITGRKYVYSTLRVDATIENHAGDYAFPLYLFAASSTSTKQRFYTAGSAIESGSSEVVTFYFQPYQAGTWNLWITTDTKGENVIGQATVEISEQNPVQLSINSTVRNSSGNTIKAENMVIKVDITNTGEYAYDDVVEALLYKQEPDTSSSSQVDTKKLDLQLESGADTSFDFTFDDLEDGSTYSYYILYYSTNGYLPIKKWTGGYSYLFKYTPDSGEIIPGDANGDGEVNVSDIVEIVNDIMGKTSAKFVRDAADLNNDGEINVTDIVKVVSIIMSAGNGARVKTTLLENTDNDVLALTCNNDKTLSLGLRNAGGYVASQFDVRLSGGATLEGMILNNGRSDSHLLTYSEIDDNLYRVVIYSPENHSFVGNEGELLNIKTSGIGDVEIENILFITESQVEKRFSPLRTSTTGIQTVEATSESMDVYSLDGRQISTDGNLQQLPKGVYIINKKKVIVK